MKALWIVKVVSLLTMMLHVLEAAVAQTALTIKTSYIKKLRNKRMNKLEYIPGDLVMTNGVPLGTAKDVVYRVTSSDPSKTLELDDGTVLKGIVCLGNL